MSSKSRMYLSVEQQGNSSIFQKLQRDYRMGLITWSLKITLELVQEKRKIKQEINSIKQQKKKLNQKFQNCNVKDLIGTCQRKRLNHMRIIHLAEVYTMKASQNKQYKNIMSYRINIYQVLMKQVKEDSFQRKTFSQTMQSKSLFQYMQTNRQSPDIRRPFLLIKVTQSQGKGRAENYWVDIINFLYYYNFSIQKYKQQYENEFINITGRQQNIWYNFSNGRSDLQNTMTQKLKEDLLRFKKIIKSSEIQVFLKIDDGLQFYNSFNLKIYQRGRKQGNFKRRFGIKQIFRCRFNMNQYRDQM
ncbi:unnamed protein product [Paramecium sonneborni]|uniref:Uncharacterized protein n=1 Tax=Paramecium sonneborni TaxID=65129 RepID=A0A8S1MNW4_9CILI|nr:unnamed protein product [Paramecium sonneborni]